MIRLKADVHVHQAVETLAQAASTDGQFNPDEMLSKATPERAG